MQGRSSSIAWVHTFGRNESISSISSNESTSSRFGGRFREIIRKFSSSRDSQRDYQSVSMSEPEAERYHYVPTYAAAGFMKSATTPVMKEDMRRQSEAPEPRPLTTSDSEMTLVDCEA